jgi:ParB family chromosome partitioning protein
LDPSGGADGHPTGATPDSGPLPVAGARYAELDVASIQPNPQQPRTVFDEEALDELARSVREVGVLQPVVVREVGPGKYQLIMGERRWRASQAAGVATVPAIVRDTADTDLLRDALLENLHRQQLNPLEEGAAYQQLLEEFDGTHEELASRLGKSRSHVSNTMRLLNLPPTVQRRLAAGVLSAGHARALLALADPEAQERLATRIVAEGLSVRAVEELVTLNETGSPAKVVRRQVRPHAPALASLASRLSDHFETRVKVELGRSKGKITLEFASVDDLERIVAAMAPGAVQTLDATPAS